MTRTIRKSDLEGKSAFDSDGKPLFESVATEEPVSTPAIPTPVAPPVVNVAPPIVNVAPAEVTVRPEIIVQAPAVTVQAPDMQPIADAISDMRDSILESIQPVVVPAPTVNFEPQPAADFSPLSEAMREIAEAVKSKPDHSEAIIGLLSMIASRPQTTGYSFKITRDAHGDVEDVAVLVNRETVA